MQIHMLASYPGPFSRAIREKGPGYEANTHVCSRPSRIYCTALVTGHPSDLATCYDVYMQTTSTIIEFNYIDHAHNKQIQIY